MARHEQSADLVEWMQTVLAADRDVLAEVLRAGIQALKEAKCPVTPSLTRLGDAYFYDPSSPVSPPG